MRVGVKYGEGARFLVCLGGLAAGPAEIDRSACVVAPINVDTGVREQASSESGGTDGAGVGADMTGDSASSSGMHCGGLHNSSLPDPNSVPHSSRYSESASIAVTSYTAGSRFAQLEKQKFSSETGGLSIDGREFS